MNNMFPCAQPKLDVSPQSFFPCFWRSRRSPRAATPAMSEVHRRERGAWKEGGGMVKDLGRGRRMWVKGKGEIPSPRSSG
eukprot:752402-Hanusia_phi.AAC.7